MGGRPIKELISRFMYRIPRAQNWPKGIEFASVGLKVSNSMREVSTNDVGIT